MFVREAYKVSIDKYCNIIYNNLIVVGTAGNAYDNTVTSAFPDSLAVSAEAAE